MYYAGISYLLERAEVGHVGYSTHINMINNVIRSALTLSARDRLYTSESDVCRRQILTYKDGPGLKELKYF